jgi:hypothetical protein
MERLDKILQQIQVIQIDISKMQVDLAHHIKRSDAHEVDISHLKKVKYMMAGALSLISIVGTVLGIYGIFQ